MPLDFTAIDFETANSSNASACSVGLVKVRRGVVIERTGWLIRPPVGHDLFTEWNTRIHGIRFEDVERAPRWDAQLTRITAFIGGDVVAAHNAGFDMGVMTAACSASGLDVPELDYVCSLQIARKTYHLDSYRLPVAAMAAGFEEFEHHNATADAEACAAILIHAAKRHGADTLADLAQSARTRIGRIGAPLEVRRSA